MREAGSSCTGCGAGASVTSVRAGASCSSRAPGAAGLPGRAPTPAPTGRPTRPRTLSVFRRVTTVRGDSKPFSVGSAGSSDTSASTSLGRVTSAMVPGPEESRSSTTMPCRAARRATTCRPMDRTSPIPAFGSRSPALSTARRSVVMPTPSSTIWTTARSQSRHTATPTGASGGEKRVALSRSSARMCATSCTARAAMPMPASTAPRDTRSKRSICWAAATMTVEQPMSAERTRALP